MATKNEENWMIHYNELKAYVAVHHHFPVRHTTLKNSLLADIWTSIREGEGRKRLSCKSLKARL